MPALNSQEHVELMAQFESQFRTGHVSGYGRLDREKNKANWAKGHLYEDGRVNDMFLAFRSGYALGQAVERQAGNGE